jgi:hypothetical protein
MNIFLCLQFASYPDWISAIALAIGVPGALVSFITLFLRDQQKDEILKEQNELNRSIQTQVSEIKRQTEEMRRSSKLQKELNEIFRNQFQQQNQLKQKEHELLEKEKEKKEEERKQDIKPHLVVDQLFGGNVKGKNPMIWGTLINVGSGIAKQVSIESLKDEIHSSFNEKTLEKSLIPQKDGGGVLYFFVKKTSDHENFQKFEYSFSLRFQDIDGNWYYQEIKGRGMNIKEFEFPQEVF